MEDTINQRTLFILFIFLVLVVSISCSLSSIQKKTSSAKQTADALRTDVGAIVDKGNSLIETAQGLETQHPGVLATVKSVATQAAPVINALEAAATEHPGLIQTAKAAIQGKIPSGEPPLDIPLLEHQQMQDYFGSSQYIFYTSASTFAYVMDFYKSAMSANGWQYLEDDSHQYSNAAQLIYQKDDRRATINLSHNPLNNTTTIVVNITNP